MLDYVFQDTSLLALALTHASHTHENLHLHAGEAPGDAPAAGFDNERLEFVGDAVLGMIVSEALYHAFPVSDEGTLTRLRSSLVARPSLAALGERLRLAPMLTLGESAARNDAARRPAVLADAVEALIAAVYLDGGFEAARSLVETQLIAPARAALKRAVEDAAPGYALRDAKSLLQERAQAEARGRVQYVDVAQSGPAHALRFQVAAQLVDGDKVTALAEAEAGSKKQAQQIAAQQALDAWNEVVEAGDAA